VFWCGDGAQTALGLCAALEAVSVWEHPRGGSGKMGVGVSQSEQNGDSTQPE